MTASFRASLARSNPATSDHFTFGFSVTIAPPSCCFILSCSALSSFDVLPPAFVVAAPFEPGRAFIASGFPDSVA